MSHKYTDSLVSLQQFIPSPEATACLSESTAQRLQIVALARQASMEGERLLLACVDPADTVLAERVSRLIPAGLKPVLLAASVTDIRAAIGKCYASGVSLSELTRLCQDSATAVTVVQEQPDAIVRLFEDLLLNASRQSASDIHVSPGRRSLQVRFRVDGVLRHYLNLSMGVFNGLLVRIKILASVDIADTRRPQDGQFRQFIDGRDVDFRVSCFPTVDGQNIVVRLLSQKHKYDTLQSLQLPASVHDRLAQLAQRPEGLLVVCGPTGSGKSNTLHALLHERDASTLNIMTLEDPVELHMEGVRQSSIDAEHAMDYAQGVRGLLRQDPDVLLIGEIRDTPSCAMALRAVMSGHQVLSTVHAQSALAGLARLRELGAGPGQLADNLIAIASQRLLRLCCRDCSGEDPECRGCYGSGYQGRRLVMELLLITPRLSALIAADASPQALVDCAQEQGFRTLRYRALQLVKQGVTRDAELDRVLGRESRRDIRLSRHSDIKPGRVGP